MKKVKEIIERLSARSVRWAALAIAIGLAGSTWAAAVGDTVTWTNADGLSASDVVNANHCSFSLQLPETAGLAKGSVVRITNVQIASINSQRVSNSSNNQNDPHSIAIGATRSSEVSFITSETLAGKYIDSYDFSNGVEVEVGKKYRESWGAKYDQFSGCGVTFLHSNGNRWSGGTTMNCTVGGTTSGAIANGTTVFPIYKITATVVAVAQNVERTIVANADATWGAEEWTVGGVADQAFVPSSDIIYNVTVTVGGDCTVTMPASIGSFKTCNVNFVLDGSAEAANVTLKYSGTLPSDSATTANFSPFGSASVTAGEGVTLMPVYAGSTEGYATVVDGVNFYSTKRPNIGVVSVRIGARTAEAAGGNIDPSYSNVGPYPLSGMLWNQTKLWNNNSISGTYTDIQNLKDAKDGSSSVRIAYYGHNTYFNSNAATSPNMVLTKTYLDDSDSGNGNLTATDGNESITLPTPGHVRGWQLHFDNIPYNAYDVYFITASDVENGNLKETPIYVSLDGGATWKSYCGDSVNQKTVMGTDNWTGLPYAANGVLVHGKNYIKMRITKSIYGDNIGTIDITHGVRNTGSSIRSGLAAIQIVEVQNDGVYTLQESGNWSDAVWSVGSLTDQIWTDTVEGDASIAKIASSATVSSVNVDAAVSAGSVVLTGSEPFTVAGSSTLTVETGFDASAFTGSLNLQAPIAGTIYIGANTDLEFGGDTDMTLPAYTLDGAGAWQKVGSGKLTVNNPLTLAGTVNAGSLEFTSSNSGNLSLVGGDLVLAGGETELIYSGEASLADQGSGKTVVASGVVQSTGRIETDIDVENGAKLKLGALRGFGSGGASVGSTPSGKTITIKQGGTIELNGTEGCNEYTLAGGTLQNSGNAIAVSQRQTMGLTLTDDSIVNAASTFGLVNNGYAAVTVTLNGNTLTKTGANTFILCNVSTDDSGAIEVAEGTMSFQGSASTLSVPVTVAQGAALNVAVASTVSSVDGEGSVTGSATLTVNDQLDLTDGLTVAAPVALADGATVTLGTGSITGAITVPDNASVTVDATDAVVAGTTTVLSSMTIGEGATIDVTNLPAGYAAQVTENSVVLVQMVTVTIPPVTGATLESVTCGGNDVSIVDGTVTVPAESTITLNWAAEEGYIIGTTPTTFDVGTEDTTVSGTGLIETVQAVARANDTLCPSLAMAITVVPDGGTVTLLQPSSDNITLSNNKSIVFVENGKAFGGKLTGNGKIRVNTAPTLTYWSPDRFSAEENNEWTGTFIVGWTLSGQMQIGRYGISGSKIEVVNAIPNGYFSIVNDSTSVMGAPTIAPAIYFDNDVTINNGFGGSGSETTFAKVGMAANKTFTTRGTANNGTGTYYKFTELEDFEGTIAVNGADHVTIGTVMVPAQPAANDVVVKVTKGNNAVLDGTPKARFPYQESYDQVSLVYSNAIKDGESGYYKAVAGYLHDGVTIAFYASFADVVEYYENNYQEGDKIRIADAAAGNVPTGWEITGSGNYLWLTKIQVPITWDVDGVQTVTYVDYGDTPSYTGETPTKTDTDEWDYEFTGWDKDFAPVTAAVTYTAQFSATKKQYTLTVPVVANATATVTVGGVEQSGVAGEGETVYTFDYGTAAVVTYTADTYYSVTANGTQNFTLTGNDEAVAPTVTRNTVTVTVPFKVTGAQLSGATVGETAYNPSDLDPANELVIYTIPAGSTLTLTWEAIAGYFFPGAATTTVDVGSEAVTVSGDGLAQPAKIVARFYASADATDSTPYAALFDGYTGALVALAQALMMDSTSTAYVEVVDPELTTPNEYATSGIGYSETDRKYARAVTKIVNGDAAYLNLADAWTAAGKGTDTATITVLSDPSDSVIVAADETLKVIAGEVDLSDNVSFAEGIKTSTTTEEGVTTYTARDWYTWTLSLGTHPNATVTGLPVEVSEGDAVADRTVSFTVTADATYKVTAVKVDGAPLVGDNGTYTYTVSGDATVTVETELDVVTFTVPALANATVTEVTGATPTGNANEYTATIGDAVTVTYTANDGYVFAGGATATTVNWTAAAAAAPTAPASAPVVAVAKIGDNCYASLEAALDAAVAGDTVTLLANVSATAQVVVSKAITLDGGNHTLTTTADWAINVHNVDNATVTIKDLTVTPGSATERFVSVEECANLTLNITGCDMQGCTYYAVNVRGSNTGLALNIDDTTLSGYCALNFWGNSGTVTVTDSTLVGVNNSPYSLNNNEFGVIVCNEYNANQPGYAISVSNTTLRAVSNIVTQGKRNDQYILLYNPNTKGNTIRLTDCTVEHGEGDAATYAFIYEEPGTSGNTTYLKNVTLAGEAVELPEGYAYSAPDEDGYRQVVSAVAAVNGTGYATLKAALDAISGETEEVTIELLDDATLDLSRNGNVLGGDAVTKITVDGNGNTLTFVKSETWAQVNTTNNAELVLNNVALAAENSTNFAKSVYNDDLENPNHNIAFNCEVELNNVTSSTALSFFKDASLDTVAITDTNNVYSIWIHTSATSVSIKNLEVGNPDSLVTSAIRGIKVDDSFVRSVDGRTPSATSITINGATFTTAKKAAVLVNSAYATAVTATGEIDISGVTKDDEHLVWVDEAAADKYSLVTVTGATKAVEPIDNGYAATLSTGNIINGYYKTLAAAVTAATTESVAMLKDVTETFAVAKTITIARGGFTAANMTAGEGYTLNTTDEAYGVQTAKVEVETDEDDPTPTTAEPVTVLVAVPKACAADELIDTANRAEGDVLKAYVKADDCFYTWELKSGAWEPKETYKVYDESSATVSTKPAAEVNLTAGQSVWVTITTEEAIKLLVTYNETPVAVEVEAGWNMVAPTTPGGTKVSDIIETLGDAITEKDAIVIPASGNGGAPKIYNKVNGEWGYDDIEYEERTIKGQKVKVAKPFRNTTDTTIKAGRGVWFVNGGDTEKNIDL